MEFWDVYDHQRVKTGRVMVRGSAFAPDSYHLVVFVCVFNAQGKMLIQHRQSSKKDWPGLWDLSAGGSAVQGESSQAAAERETWEELGLRVNLQGVRPHLTVNSDHGFIDLYLVRQEAALSALRLQAEEVQAVKWADEDEICAMIDRGGFVPYHPSLIRLLFAMRHRYGGMKAL